MEKKAKIKKVIIIVAIVILFVATIIFAKLMIDKSTINKQMKTAINAITINENVPLYSSAKEKKKIKELNMGTNIYILENITDKNGKKWSKVKTDTKVGYILSENLDSYKKNDMKKTLMLDVSKFNMQNNFCTIGEFKAFLLKNNINYVYIRAGGRGYGEAGNFYTDTKYKEYSDACEFLKIPFGYYFLDEAITSEEVDEEVKFITEFIQNNKYENNILPIALDVEKHIETGRADGIWDTRYILVNELIEKLQQNGHSAIVYSNAKIANQYLENVNAKLWLAYYPEISKMPKYWFSDTSADGAKNELLKSKIVAWQFTETGIKDKINQKIDLSLVYNCFFENGSMNDINNDITGKSKHVKNIFYLKNKKNYSDIFSFSNSNYI